LLIEGFEFLISKSRFNLPYYNAVKLCESDNLAEKKFYSGKMLDKNIILNVYSITNDAKKEVTRFLFDLRYKKNIFEVIR